VLLGGNGPDTMLTAESVPGPRTFDLRHSGDSACGIPDEDTIVMTGGASHNFVTRYNVNGFVEELPRLPGNRWDHACAALPSTKVFIIAGGVDESGQLSSVLTLLHGAQAWTPLASLPRPLKGARASIVAGRMRLTGGMNGTSFRDEVLEYQPEPSNQWTTVGQQEAERGYHSVISIGPELLPCLKETETTKTETKTTTSSGQDQSSAAGSTDGASAATTAPDQDETGDFPVVEVATTSGIILLVIGIIAVISCVICRQRKRPEEKQEEVDADENPVYGVYQLTETYERQYSTNEAVDNNDYYGQ